MKSGKLTYLVLLGLGLGVLVGLTGHALIHDQGQLAAVSTWLDLVTTTFLRAIKMLIAPLVLSTLLGGIARAAGTGTLGRMAAQALAWFFTASVIALLIGLAVVVMWHPGVGLHLNAQATGEALASVARPSFAKFAENLLPNSLLDAMARNEILQVVMFTLVAGAALAQLKDRGADLVRLSDAVSELMLKMAMLIMSTAPVAVFAALASVLIKRGPAVVATFASYVGGIYLALALLWCVLIAAGAVVLGVRTQFRLLRAIREPALLAFATTSSESAYPVLLARLEEFGVASRVASFVLPLGYSFNLVGSMCYGVFAAIFLTQAYDVHLGSGQIVQLLLLLFLTSKGIANVPRASLLVVATVLPYFGVPQTGILLVLGVDAFVDMGRTCTNTVATAIAAASVAKWEKALQVPERC